MLLFLVCFPVKANALQSFEKSVTLYPSTENHVSRNSILKIINGIFLPAAVES